MADVSVNGWTAEGGHTIIEGKKNNIILFDVVENVTPVNGIDDDVFNNNKSWYHCGKEFVRDHSGPMWVVMELLTFERE